MRTRSSYIQCSWNRRPCKSRSTSCWGSRPSWGSGERRWKHPGLTLTSPGYVWSALLTLPPHLLHVFLCTGLVHPGCDLPSFPSLQHQETTAPCQCSNSGRCEPCPRRLPLPLRRLRSSRSPPETTSLLFARRNVMLWSTETPSSRHVCATLAKDKVHTHCFPVACVLDVSVQRPMILKGNESIAAVVIHAGVNDTKMWQMETLKRDFRSMIEMVRNTSTATMIIVSGPFPSYRREQERFSRLFALNKWLLSWCKVKKLLFVNNWNLFLERPRLFRAMVCTPAESGQNSCWKTSPGRCAPSD